MRMDVTVAKIVKNLSLDSDAVERGEKFSRRKGTTISRLVSDFLIGLEPSSDESHAPAVKRLIGIARGKADRADYHAYLSRKYGA